MRNKYLLISGLAMITLSNCKKPEACIQPSASSVKLGQEVTFSDCSENGEFYKYDFGDGSTISTEKEPVHVYEEPGTYTVSVEIKDKKKKKEDETTASITVADYTSSDVVGTWTLYKTADFTDDWWFGGGSAGSNATAPNYKYVFTADSVKIYDNGNPPYLMQNSSWSKPGSGEIAVGTTIYKVVKAYNNELYLKLEDGFWGYTIYYFKK
jgi:PKD repeat protein